MLKYFFKKTYQQFLTNQNSIEKEKKYDALYYCFICIYVLLC